jgi:hypothetical protein
VGRQKYGLYFIVITLHSLSVFLAEIFGMGVAGGYPFYHSMFIAALNTFAPFSTIKLPKQRSHGI